VSGMREESKMIFCLFGMSDCEKKVKGKNDVFFIECHKYPYI
jgi:hypothetical protein